MTYKRWTRTEDIKLVKTADADLTTAFPGVGVETLRRRRRLLRNQPAMSVGVSLATSGLERLSTDLDNFTAYVIGDFQVPYHNKKALAAFNHLLADQPVDLIINDGDHWDNYSISRFGKDPRRASIEAWREEVEEGRVIFEDWKKVHKGEIVLLKGNHEKRWSDFCNQSSSKILEAAGEALSFEHIYGLDDLGVVTFDYMQPVTFGNVTITHGTKGNSGTPGAMVLGEIRKRFGTHVIVGHCHTGAMTTQRYIGGSWVGIENFTMADVDGLEYTMFPNWHNGFTFLRVVNGEAHLQPIVINNNEFVFNGKLYTPTGVK